MPLALCILFMKRVVLWSALFATLIELFYLILSWVGDKGITLQPANSVLMLVMVPALVLVYFTVKVYPPSAVWLVAHGHSPPTGLLFWIWVWIVAFIEMLIVCTLWRRWRRTSASD
jgi:hypothetical protein